MPDSSPVEPAGVVPPETAGATRRDLAAIALVSCAVLLVEIAITRILSVIVWYHFAFLSISLAMLGLGAPGVWFALRKPSPRALSLGLLLGGATLPLGLVALFRFGRPLQAAGRVFSGPESLLNAGLLLVIVCILIPMLCLGSAICLLLLRARGRAIGRLYAADLIGAAAGAVLVVPLLLRVPTPLVVAGAGFLPFAAAALLDRRARVPALVAAAALAGAMAWGEPFALRYTKEYIEPPGKLFERWTPTARITIYSGIFFGRRPELAFGWGMGSRYQPRPVSQLWLEQDGSAGTPITQLDRPLQALDHLQYDVTGLAYQVAPPRRVCIIGGGGGRDILTALQAGAGDVDAVELNPTIVDAVSNQFGSFSGDPYHRPGVHAVVSEGRSYLTRSSGNYDLVQISLIDSWAATAAGAFALSENFLYTLEAMRLYWARTSEDGMVSISRYATGERAYEMLRLVRLARRALEAEGVASPEQHLVVTRSKDVATVLLLRRPLGPDLTARLQAVAAERGFLLLWPPLTPAVDAPRVEAIVRRGSESGAEAGIDLSPPTDDRPFYFQNVPIFARARPAGAARLSSSENSVLLLRALLGLLAILAVALFLAPFVLFRQQRGPGFWRGSAYFFAIGAGFMLVEVPWIQRFVLYLGHPSYATTVVLSTLLLAAGLGSALAARVDTERVRRLAPLLPALLAALNLVLVPLLPTTLGAPLALRVVVSLAAIAPAGFLMGFAFPAGMLRFGAANQSWFWAMNGIAGVTASVLALALCMSIGLLRTALVGVAVYAVAWWLLSFGSAPRARPAIRG